MYIESPRADQSMQFVTSCTAVHNDNPVNPGGYYANIHEKIYSLCFKTVSELPKENSIQMYVSYFLRVFCLRQFATVDRMGSG